MDDRGKFIYISEDELLGFKKFIEHKGRVNISDLARSSNELISLKSVTSGNSFQNMKDSSETKKFDNI
jgi:hypothetical protein